MPPPNPLSLPTDVLRWVCTGAAVLLVFAATRRGGGRWFAHRAPPRWLFWLAPLAAAALSAAYVSYYLRGGPRIIDATAYFLEGRTFAAGMLTFPLPEPEHAAMGRFLVRAGTEGRAAVIFPPGYPAVLAIGFAFGAPLAVGPALAALLVVATVDLARVAARATGHAHPGTVATYAGIASVVCAALRYHTADTMSHGLAALCVTVAVAAWLRLAHDPQRTGWPAVALGFAAALLFATRPASALALVVALAVGATLGWRPASSWRTVLAAATAAAGPLALWLAYQSAATGTPFATAQSVYYAASDGPPGCFGYGFGDVGCLGEHGTFVRAELPDGYGLVEAAKTTGRRLMMHVSDAMGFAPAFAAVIAGGWVAVRHRASRVLVAVVVLQWLAYAPFYFDGNYPGGGARMFADILPIEHVLAALGLGAWRWKARRLDAARSAVVLVAAALLGFGIHLGAHHEQLRDREGGQPMFDPEVAGAAEGMLFVDTDHGFNLGFDPTRPTRVVRRHGDALDALVWEHAGRPTPHRYAYSFESGAAHVRPLVLAPLGRRFAIEGESLWPATSQRKSWAFPRHVAPACASSGRVLAITPTGPRGEVRLALPDAVAGTHIRLRAIALQEKTSIKAVIYSLSQPVAAAGREGLSRSACSSIPPILVPPGATGLELALAADGPFGLDRVEMIKIR